MLRRFASLFVSCACLALPALAQDAGSPPEVTTEAPVEGRRQQGWGFRVGWLQGDEIGRSPGYPSAIEGLDRQPEMDDVPFVGVHWSIAATRTVDVEVRAQFGQTSIEPVCPDADENSPASCAATQGSVDALLWTFEVAVMPHLDWDRFHLGFPVGWGWATLHADSDFAPKALASGRDDTVRVADSSGAMYFVGVRPYWDLGKKMSVFGEARWVIMHRLMSVNYSSVRSGEVSAGVSFRFGK
jgi:hypothetical protein